MTRIVWYPWIGEKSLAWQSVFPEGTVGHKSLTRGFFLSKAGRTVLISGVGLRGCLERKRLFFELLEVVLFDQSVRPAPMHLQKL
jgi:hypothetical protein